MPRRLVTLAFEASRDKIIYIAGPYSDPDEMIQHARADELTRFANALMREGFHVFSPITHGHPIAAHGGLPYDWEYWGKSCRLFLAACGHLAVLTMPGWGNSRGVAAEVAIAESLDMPITYIPWPLNYTSEPANHA